MKESANLLSYFDNLEDHRTDRCKKHLLLDIIGISVCAVICGADSWNEIEEYGKMKKSWLNSFLELPYGIPSHDTFNRFYSNLDPEQFEECFSNWVNSIANLIKSEIISVDGKTIRGAKINGNSSIHMVSAWSCGNDMVLGQIKVAEKSNEITAIPKLLESIIIGGAIITIDAMGTQKKIAKKIIKNNADYTLAVKGNQPLLRENIEDEFRFNKKIKSYQDVDYGHGRIETRTCHVISDFIHIQEVGKWEKLQSVIKIDSIREFKATGKIETATKYYISSLINSPKESLRIVRNHWAIENKLHWVLDVQFGEDLDRKRAGNASQNFSLINKIALNLITKEKSCKLGIKSKRKKAGWENSYLEKILIL